MKQLPKISEMEHITSKELGENLDTILDRVSKEDIALIIDHQVKSYILCPARWFELPGMEHIEVMVKNSVRYAITNDTDLKETAAMVIEFLPALSRDCIRVILDTAKGRKQFETCPEWDELEHALTEALASTEQNE